MPEITFTIKKTIMKIFSTIAMTFVFLILFASCKYGRSVKQLLSKPASREEVMNKIANNSSMSGEMIEAMMNNTNGNFPVIENQVVMLRLAEDYQARMQVIMDNEMEIDLNKHSMNIKMMIN